MKLLSCLGLLAALCCCEAYSILVVFPLPSRSHGILGSGIVKPLLQAGHEVTYVTPFPLTDPPNNLHQVDVGFLQEKWQRNLSPNFLAGSSMSLSFLTSIGYNSSTALLECGQIQKILRDRNQKFDAVVTEWFFSDLFAGFGAVLQCPWILFSSVGMHAGLEYLTGEVQSPAVQPAIITGYSAPMSLYERVANTVIVFGSVLKTKFTDHPHDTPAYDRFFKTAAEARGVTIPDFTEAVTNISIILLNSHVSLGQAARLPPNAVEIGGYHIDTNTPELPKDLHDLLDHAQHGVIYFSMGSNLKSADLPVDKRNALMDVFRGLKETVLWKFETELPDVPKNVHIRSWFPQQSILAHKNVKMFITHGGLLSTTEAIHFGVPLIGIPVFGDQPMNMDRAVKKGYAIRVNLKSPQIGKDLGDSIKEMLANPSYRNTVQRLSKLFHDRPAHPASLVSYWTEHAVRTAGAQHLRTAASAVPAYQRYLLDILAILLAVLAIVLYVLRAILRWMLSKRSYKEKMY